jgi:hypothetical protein
VCEIWFLTLRKEHILRVFKIRRILGPKRNDVTGGWRTLHNEELHVGDEKCIQNFGWKA